MSRILTLLLLLALDTPAQQFLQGQSGESLGHSLIVADLDGDGGAEVAAGAPRFTEGSSHYRGRVAIIRAGSGPISNSKLTMTPDQRISGYPNPSCPLTVVIPN